MFNAGSVVGFLELKDKSFSSGAKQASQTMDGLKAKAKQLQTELDESSIGSAKFKGLQKELSGVKSEMASATAGSAMLMGGLAAAGTAVVMIGQKAIKAAADIEQAKVSFSVFAGGGEAGAAAAEKMLASLNELANKTPFMNSQVINAAKTLMAFGTSADDVEKTLTMVGDVASATGKDFNELAVIYGKARVQGTLFAEDINQLTEAGVPVIQEFAKQLGVTEGEVKKMGSEGKIQFANLERAFASMTGEGGQFFNMMALQSETVTGKISTLEGKFTSLLAKVGDGGSGLTKGALDGLIGIVDEASRSVDEIGEEFSKIGQDVGIISALLGNSGEEVDELNDKVSMSDKLFKKLIDMTIIGGVRDIAQGTSSITGALKTAAGVWGDITDQARTLSTIHLTLDEEQQRILKEGLEPADKIWTAILQKMDLAATKTESLADLALNELDAAWQSISDTTGEWLDSLGESTLLQELAPHIEEMKADMAAFSEQWDQWTGKLSSAWDTLAGMVGFTQQLRNFDAASVGKGATAALMSAIKPFKGKSGPAAGGAGGGGSVTVKTNIDDRFKQVAKLLDLSESGGEVPVDIDAKLIFGTEQEAQELRQVLDGKAKVDFEFIGVDEALKLAEKARGELAAGQMAMLRDMKNAGQENVVAVSVQAETEGARATIDQLLAEARNKKAVVGLDVKSAGGGGGEAEGLINRMNAGLTKMISLSGDAQKKIEGLQKDVGEALDMIADFAEGASRVMLMNMEIAIQKTRNLGEQINFLHRVGTIQFQSAMDAEIEAARDAGEERIAIEHRVHNERMTLLDEEAAAIEAKLLKELELIKAKDSEEFAIQMARIENESRVSEQEAVLKAETAAEFEALKELRDQEHQERLREALQDADKKKESETRRHNKVIETEKAASDRNIAALEAQKAASLKARAKEVAAFQYLMTLAVWKAEKDMKLKEIQVQTGIGIMRGISSAMSVPFPLSIAAAIINTEMVLATSAASTSMINSAPPPLPPAELVAETGGMVKGPSHAQGGVNVNAEGGELIFSRADSAAMVRAVENGAARPSGGGGIGSAPVLNVYVQDGAIRATRVDVENREAVEEIFSALKPLLRNEIADASARR